MKFPKEIYSAYFTYTDDVFSFHVYQFTDIDDFNSLKKIREYEFVFEEESQPVTRETLKVLLAQQQVSVEPRRLDGELVPFIQANDPEKIFEIPVVLSGKPLMSEQGDVFEIGTKEFFAEAFKFDVRQSDYYANASEYFSLAQKVDGRFKVSQLGRVFIDADYNTKIGLFAKELVQRPIFRAMIEIWVATGHLPDNKTVGELIKLHRPDIGGSTVPRRASSVNAVMNWFVMRIQ